MSYKAVCKWLLLVLGLEVPRRDQAVNQCWLLLVLSLEKLGTVTGIAEVRCCLFERI